MRDLMKWHKTRGTSYELRNGLEGKQNNLETLKTKRWKNKLLCVGRNDQIKCYYLTLPAADRRFKDQLS